MARTRRTGVIQLAERAAAIPTTALRTKAGKGAPCVHWSGCKLPWTAWTIRGGRCNHHPLTPAETPTITDTDRQPWVHGGTYSNLSRSRSRSRSGSEQPHPYLGDPGSGRARTCADCGRGPRARAHRVDADKER